MVNRTSGRAGSVAADLVNTLHPASAATTVMTATTTGARSFAVFGSDGALLALEVASQPHGDAVLAGLYTNPKDEEQRRRCKEWIDLVDEMVLKHEAIADQTGLREYTDNCRKLVGK